MSSVLLLVAFVVYLQGVGHEKALQNVGQIVSEKLHETRCRNASQKSDWFSHARRHSAVNGDDVLPPAERLAERRKDQEREAENCF